MNDLSLSVNLEIQFLDITLCPSFQAGPELVVIFGPSGAGKSVTLRALAGLVTPIEGQIQLANRVIFDASRGINLPPQKRNVGYVPQNYALFPHRTISENIAFGLNNLDRQVRDLRVKEFLATMHLENEADRKPGEVSGGQQQRVALARALAPRPSLLLLDEPFGALDEPIREHLRNEIRSLQQRYEIPIILVTHNLEEAYTMADQLVVIESGEVAQAGPRDDVFRRPISPSVGKLMGMDNIFEAKITTSNDGETTLTWTGIDLHVDGRLESVSGESVVFGIRPEEIELTLHPSHEGVQIGDNRFQCVLINDQSRGSDHDLSCRISGSDGSMHDLRLRITHSKFKQLGLEIGQQATILIPPSAIHIFPNS